MPDTAHPIAPRGLSPITELTTPRSLPRTLPSDELDHPHPSYASIREGGSDRSSAYSQASAGSGGTVTPRPRRVSLPRGPDLGPTLARVPAPQPLAPRDEGPVDSVLTLPAVSPSRPSHRKPFPSPSQQPGGLPPPPRRRGTPPPTSPTRPTMDRPHSWQPRSASETGTIEEESDSLLSDPSVLSSAVTTGQAGIGTRSNFEATIEEPVQAETEGEVLSPASTLLAPRPSLHQSHSSPAISRGIEPTPSPPVPQVELLSQTLNASADATPPISPAGSRRSRGSRSANILRKRAKSMTGKKMSPKIQSSSERPRSVLGTSNVRVGSSSTLGKRQPTPPRRESSVRPPAQSRPSSSTGSITAPSTRTRKGSQRTPRRSIVSSLFSIFDPSSRHRTSQASLGKSPNENFAVQSTVSEELLSVDGQTVIRTSGTFGVRDDGSVLEDPNKSPRSLGHFRTRTESGPTLSALSAATSGLSGNGSAKSMGLGRVLYVQNLAGQASEDKPDAQEPQETVLDTVPQPLRKPIPSDPPLEEVLAITSSPEQTAAPPAIDSSPPSKLPPPSRARRDISKGSSASDHTFGEPSPGQGNPSPGRRGSTQSHTPPPVLALGPDSHSIGLASSDLSQAVPPGSRPGSARASPIRPLPRRPSSSPRAVQTPPVDLLKPEIPHNDAIGSNRPLSVVSHHDSDSITPRASQIPHDDRARDILHVPGPTLNIPAPPSVSPGPSRESSWYAPERELLAVGSETSPIPSDQAGVNSPPDERRQAGPPIPGEAFHQSSRQQDGHPHRHSHQSQRSARGQLPYPQVAALEASAPGSATDLPFLIASHVLSTHAAQLMQQSTDMHEVSEAIRRMAKESLDWGGVLMRLSEESRTGRPAAGGGQQRPVSMPESFPPGFDGLRALPERLRTKDQAPPVPPVPDIPEPYRSSSRPAPPPPPVPPGAYDPLYDAWLRLHGDRPPTVHDPFTEFPDYRHLSAYHHPYVAPRPHPVDYHDPSYHSHRPEEVRDKALHSHTPAPHAQRQRRTQSLEYPVEWVREADRLGMEGWSNLHQAEEAWHIAMGFLRRVVEEGHDLATRGRARPYTDPVTTDHDTSTGGRGWRYYHPRLSGQRLSDEYERPDSRTSKVRRQPSPTPKVGSRASTPSRYGPEGSGPAPPLPPLHFSPILESPESAHRHSSFSRRSEYGEGRQREMSFLPRAEDMVSMPRSYSPSFRRSDIKSRRVLGADAPATRSQSYTFPVLRLRPDLVPHSHSVGPGTMIPLYQPVSAEDFGPPEMGRPTHGRQRSQGPTSTFGSKGTTRRKLRKGVKRTPTGGTLRTMGIGTMLSGGPMSPTLDAARRTAPTQRRQGSRSSNGSRGSSSGSEAGLRARPPSPLRKWRWWTRRK